MIETQKPEIYKAITEGYKLRHTFILDQNYGIKDGRVLLVDGGDKNLAKFLDKYGEELFNFLSKEENIIK